MMKLTQPKTAKIVPMKGVMDSWITLKLNEVQADRRPLWGDIRPVSKGWRPSSLGEPNDRLLIISQFGYRGEKIEPGLRRIFDAGNAIEDTWIKRFGEMGVKLGQGQWLPKEGVKGLRVAGKIDIMVEHAYEPGRKFIVEVKSISSDGYRQLPAVSMDSEENYHNLMAMKGVVGARVFRYMYQLQFYLEGLNMDEGIMLFDNKGTQEYKDFFIYRRAGLLDDSIERLKRLQEDYWAKELVPPWNGKKTRSVIATYKTDEVVPLAEFKEVVKEHDLGEF